MRKVLILHDFRVKNSILKIIQKNFRIYLLMRHLDFYLCRPKRKKYIRCHTFKEVLKKWFCNKSSLTRLEGIEVER